MQLQFEAAMCNGLGDAFTRKYIGSLTLPLGHTKWCPVPSISCHLFRRSVKVATPNGLDGNTFSKNVLSNLSSADFFKINFFEKNPLSAKQFESRSDFVGSYLGPSCSQSLSADVISQTESLDTF